MKRSLIFGLIFTLLVLPSIMAINLDIKEISSNNVMIIGINKPALFNLEITNYGEADSFRFDNFLGFSMFPVGTIQLNSGERKQVPLMIYPRENMKERGFFNFQYVITGNDLTNIKKDLVIKIIDLEDAFEVGSSEFNPESNSIEIYIHNKENFDFGEIKTKFYSQFFNIEETYSLGPNERKDFTIELKKEDIKKLMAGFYTVNAEVTVDGKKADIEGTLKFTEKNIITTTKKDYGLIVNTQIIEKRNEGNTVEKIETSINKNIISRLFTSFSPEPDIVDRHGTNVYYSWQKEIKPGESLNIIVKTNWLFPLILVLFIIAVVMLAKLYSKTNITLKKRVSFVHAKGGEFALKVTIFIQAKKYIERVSIIDRLPPLVKIYEKFGTERPTRINDKSKRLEWDFEKLEAGEMRRLTYIIYSKVGILGKFALPRTTAVYEKDGKIQESQSNKAFFVAEQIGKENQVDE